MNQIIRSLYHAFLFEKHLVAKTCRMEPLATAPAGVLSAAPVRMLVVAVSTNAVCRVDVASGDAHGPVRAEEFERSPAGCDQRRVGDSRGVVERLDSKHFVRGRPSRGFGDDDRIAPLRALTHAFEITIPDRASPAVNTPVG